MSLKYQKQKIFIMRNCPSQGYTIMYNIMGLLLRNVLPGKQHFNQWISENAYVQGPDF